MELKLRKGDVVWSGKVGGSNKRPYRITVNNKNQLQYTHTGCWAPAEKEAIEFLRSIGVNVDDCGGSYSSGFAANGCWFSYGYEPMSPHVQEAYDLFKQKSNKYYAHTLQRMED